MNSVILIVGQAASGKGVLPIYAPAIDEIVPLLQLRDQTRDVGGIVLQISVKGDDDLSPCVRNAGGEGSSLAEVAAQADHPQ